MTGDTVAAPVVFDVAATITLGGATTLVTASGAQYGFRRSIPLIVGITIGLASLATVAALGLASLLLAAPWLRLIVTFAGTAYLVRLAWRIARSGHPDQPDRRHGPALAESQR